MAVVTTSSWPTPTQFGYEIETTGTWVEAGGPVAENLVSGIYRYDLSTLSPIVDWPNNVSSAMSLEITLAVLATSTINIQIPVNRRSLPPFSASNLPSSTFWTTIHTFSTTSPLVYLNEFDAQAMDKLNGYMRASDWNRSLPFRLTNPGGSTTIFISTATLTATYSNIALTGLNTGQAMMSRADTCPKCGDFVFREQLEMDGYTRILACASCWDPPDLTGRGRRRPLHEVNP